MKVKILMKILTSLDYLDLQEEINDFIENEEKIKDIKFSTSSIGYKTEYSVLIIYEEKWR